MANPIKKPDFDKVAESLRKAVWRDLAALRRALITQQNRNADGNCID